MALLLIRHAQASYGAANYDELSALGHAQSAELGRWLAAHVGDVAAVRVGAMKRHRQTFEAVRNAFAAAGRTLPAPTEDVDLNEFDHEAVVRGFLTQRADASQREAAASKDVKRIGAMLLAALSAWADDAIDGVPEPWGTFGDRVARAGAAVANAAQGDGDVLVFSSGGVISRLAQQALDVPASRAVELNLAIRNASINEFGVGRGRLRLASFNTLPHLAHDRAMWTHF